ncbi:MAG: hypothetical protein MSA82_02295 [Oscillospiraceae bacterium]|nr:hypothetical protein [Oscillospiraceae bacterium]
MAKENFIPFQPIKGVPVVQIGDRFKPMKMPVDKGCNDDKTVFWFIYQGSKKGKLTVDTVNGTETLVEVT